VAELLEAVVVDARQVPALRMHIGKDGGPGGGRWHGRSITGEKPSIRGSHAGFLPMVPRP
jgi:hypothetical protein